MVEKGTADGARGFTEGERELLRTLARQGLANDQQVRLMKSLIDCHRVSTAGPIIQATKQAMDGLIKAQQRLRQEQSLVNPTIQERLGPAHVHIWNSLVACAVAHAGSDTEEEKLLKAYVATIKSVADYLPDVRVAKVENMHESKHKRLCIQVMAPQHKLVEKEGVPTVLPPPAPSSHTVWPIMKKIFQRVDKGWKILPGMAPQGAQSRKAQRLLDQMPVSLEGEESRE